MAPRTACTWLVLLGVVCLTLPGCAFRVSAPAPSAPLSEPVSVFIADHGVHASLILPRDADPHAPLGASGPGSSVEFAFGAYDYYVLNRTECWRLPCLMIGPAPGTLARREWPCPASRSQLELLVPAEEFFELRVERRAAQALLDRLDARFAAGGPVALNARAPGVQFVHDEATYAFDRTCNAAIAAWLEELGCHVAGNRPAWAEFKVAQP